MSPGEEEAAAAAASDGAAAVALSELDLYACEVSVQCLQLMCHQANKRWWVDIRSGEPLQRNVGELLMLCVSELAEAMEAHRKSAKDDKLPHRPGLEVELADCLIRVFDLAGGLGLDLAGALCEKMLYNAKRVDHTHEARRLAGGKAY